jgi:tetratricopeptide (TPR) repeat protein/O-antigen ligase
MFEKIRLRTILEYGVVLLLCTPLLIGESLLFPLITTKAFFFYILVDILLVCYLLLIKEESVYPKKDKLLYFFLGITVLSFLFDIFGINFWHSFWGNYERMVGIYTTIHFVIFLWILLSVYNTKEKYTKLFDTSIIVSFLVSLYGVLQKFQVDVFGIIQLQGERLHATMGNAAFLAAYLLIHLFFIGYVFVKKKNIYWRVFYAVAFIFDFWILFATATRGALLGLAFAIFAMLLYLLVFYKVKKIRIASIIVIVTLVCSVLSLFIFKESRIVQSNLALQRISQINMTESSSQSRLLLWKMSVRAAQDHVLIGHGTNNMRIPLDLYHDYDLVEDWFDSSHNKFFDELLVHGIVGLLLYSIFLGWLFIRIIALRKTDFVLSFMLFGLLTAYVVQSFFIFDSFIIGVILTFIFGFIFVATNQTDTKMICTKKWQGIIVYPLIVFICLAGIVIYLKSIIPVRNIVRASYIIETDFEQALELYTKANTTMMYGHDVVAPFMAKTTISLLIHDAFPLDEAPRKEYLDVFVDMYEKAIQKSGNYSKFYINLAKMYQHIDNLVVEDFGDKPYPLLEKARVYAPNRIDVYYVYAQGYFNQGDTEAAINSLNEALLLGVRQEEVYSKLADIYIRKGTVEEFLYAVEQVYAFDSSFSVVALEDYAKRLIERGEWEGALEMFLKIHEIQSDNIDNYHNIALVYKKLGDKDKAIEWIQKVFVANPFKRTEVQAFINTL